MMNYKEQAKELLTKFFPPLLEYIKDEGPRLQRAPITMLAITIKEVEQ